MLQKAASVDFLVVKNESESLYLENNLIKKHKPFYNTMLKGGNGYTYIKFTPHEFPQVLLTRMKKDDKATYIGPKHNTRELRKLLQYLRQLLQYRTCPLTQFRQHKLCSDYYFHLCKGRCAGCPLTTGEPRYSSALEAKADYKQLLQLLSSFFKGNTKPIEKELLHQIQQAAERQHFERAATLRDMYHHIEQLVEKQHVELPQKISGYVLGIRTIGEWNVYVLLHFYEGKLIDVIRDKVALAQGDKYRMLAGFEADLGDMHLASSSPNLLAWSKELTLLVSQQQALEEMLQNFFDTYMIVASFEGEVFHNDLLSMLQQRYGLQHFPYRIECVDISHLSGGRISGGISCMLGGILEKKGYRKYKIRSVRGESDDYASLKEVISRRLKS
jgi:excinuclease ABC subunit C